MNIKGEKVMLVDIRRDYHRRLFRDCIRMRRGEAPNMADGSSQQSVSLARGMVDRLACKVNGGMVSPQALGSKFAEATANFIEDAFIKKLAHIRPGRWMASTSQGESGIALFSQYSHIKDLDQVLRDHPQLRSSLGGDYLITPDIVVARQPLSDSEINASGGYVATESKAAKLTPLREGNWEGSPPILLASISVKWSMRSDRAQNTRTEALNLIRNRKGGTPKIAVVTFEPLPTRLASIAMGTGDIDCTYHAALDELLATARELSGTGDQLEMLQMLVNGRRLRDISDLPLDLAA